MSCFFLSMLAKSYSYCYWIMLDLSLFLSTLFTEEGMAELATLSEGSLSLDPKSKTLPLSLVWFYEEPFAALVVEGLEWSRSPSWNDVWVGMPPTFLELFWVVTVTVWFEPLIGSFRFFALELWLRKPALLNFDGGLPILDAAFTYWLMPVAILKFELMAVWGREVAFSIPWSNFELKIFGEV